MPFTLFSLLHLILALVDVYSTMAGQPASLARSAVAMALKSTVWPEVRGILAEDDTLFVATDNVYDT